MINNIAIRSYSPDSSISFRKVFTLLLYAGVIIILIRYIPPAAYAFAAVMLFVTSQGRMNTAFLMWIMMCTMNVINPVILPQGIHYNIAMKAIILLTPIALVFGHRQQQKILWPPLGFLYLFSLYMFFPSIYGWMPIISILKLILFLSFMVCTYYLSIISYSQGALREETGRTVLLALCIFWIIGSMASIPFPVIGRSMLASLGKNIENEGLFNGMSPHSQTLGPILSILNIILLSDYYFNLRRRSWFYLSLLLCIPILIYLTSSRTAMLSYVASLVIFVYLHYNSDAIAKNVKGRFLMKVALITSLVFIFMLAVPSFSEKNESFWRKDLKNEGVHNVDLLTDITASRSDMVGQMLDNFIENPIIGHGFQVSNKMELPYSDSTESLLSAPVEKGVLTFLILEEGGLIGMILFIIFTLNIFHWGIKYKEDIFIGAFAVMLMTNLGEATIFSSSYLGGFLWIICFLSLSLKLPSTKKCKLLERVREAPYASYPDRRRRSMILG